MSRQQRRALDEQLRNAPAPAGPATVEQLRAGFAHFMSAFPIPTTVTRTPIRLAERPAVLVEPTDGPRPGTILYFHGGSFSLGSPETAMALTAQLVARTGVRALSLDYRLAPEHPFPTGIDDCVAAYRSLLEGGLAVTTTLAAREAGLPMPAGIVAFSPGLDHTRTGDSVVAKEGIDPLFTGEGLARSGELYLAGQDPAQPLLAPAVLADLTGFPPILLQVGANELLLDDSVRLADRARDAGVDVILDVVADVPHVFPAFIGIIDEADEAVDRAVLFILQRLRRR
jgi:monoterpene epsilon-lactone hydrolase